MEKTVRIGFGYDVHRLVEGRPLIIGGVEIPCDRGLAGHSDADVLLHAVCDALLGSLALGDIGSHFPDDDPEYEDVDSRKLLRKVGELIDEREFSIGNIDATITAQKPKLAPYIDRMREIIAGDLNLEKTRISIKATTTEELGFEGRQEGISSRAVVLVKNRE